MKVSLPDDLVAQLASEAKRQEVSRSALIRRYVKRGLSRGSYPPQAPERDESHAAR